MPVQDAFFRVDTPESRVTSPLLMDVALVSNLPTLKPAGQSVSLCERIHTGKGRFLRIDYRKCKENRMRSDCGAFRGKNILKSYNRDDYTKLWNITPI